MSGALVRHLLDVAHLVSRAVSWEQHCLSVLRLEMGVSWCGFGSLQLRSSCFCHPWACTKVFRVSRAQYLDGLVFIDGG